VSVADGLKTAAIILVAALLQVSLLNGTSILGGAPDLLLGVVVAVALLRGSIVGAVSGFVGGVVVDTSALSTVGVTALILTLAGYWAGRYAETTGRDRARAPAVALVAATVATGVVASLLYFLLGETVSAHTVVVVAIWPAIALNLAVGLPVYALCRRLLRPGPGMRSLDGIDLVAGGSAGR
jgi:rod shape-determining protein MreD